jgi:predicted RNA binding protein YcfA (HicA-like mRNA interferase family)
MKLKRLNAKEVFKLLKLLGWYFDSQKGSHKHLKHNFIKGKVTIPDHKDLDIGTLKSIFCQAGITLSSALVLLRQI